MTALPSLRALDQAQPARIWLATEAADMRCGFDRLAERVKAVIGGDPLSGHLFVFRSRRADRLKILVWDRDGFVLWYKGRFGWPETRGGQDRIVPSHEEMALLTLLALGGAEQDKLSVGSGRESVGPRILPGGCSACSTLGDILIGI